MMLWTNSSVNSHPLEKHRYRSRCHWTNMNLIFRRWGVLLPSFKQQTTQHPEFGTVWTGSWSVAGLMVQVNVPPPDLRSVYITAASRPPTGGRWLSAAAAAGSSVRQQLILQVSRFCGLSVWLSLCCIVECDVWSKDSLIAEIRRMWTCV